MGWKPWSHRLEKIPTVARHSAPARQTFFAQTDEWYIFHRFSFCTTHFTPTAAIIHPDYFTWKYLREKRANGFREKPRKERRRSDRSSLQAHAAFEKISKTTILSSWSPLYMRYKAILKVSQRSVRASVIPFHRHSAICQLLVKKGRKGALKFHMSYTWHAIYARESTRISEVTRVKTRVLREHCAPCFQELSRTYIFSRCVRCGHSNGHSCQTHKLCSNLLELLQSATPFSRVRRPLDDTSDRKFTKEFRESPSRFAQDVIFSVAFYKLSYMWETSPDVPNFPFDRSGDALSCWMFFKRHSDRSFSSRCTFPSIVSRSMQRRSVGEMTHSPVTCLSWNTSIRPYVRNIVFSRKIAINIFIELTYFAYVLRAFVETSCAHVVSFSYQNSYVVAMFSYSISINLYFSFIYISACSFFQSF